MGLFTLSRSTPDEVASHDAHKTPYEEYFQIKFPSFKQLRGAVEARRAHDSEVTRSKESLLEAKYLYFFLPDRSRSTSE